LHSDFFAYFRDFYRIFVNINKYYDMVAFPQELKDAIGREKFILMDNYHLIEKLWPVHII